ncbi:MAG: hypothetical protein ACLFV6_03605 [Spirulinaceae cyanobacterium]
MNVECYRMNEKNKWELTPYNFDETPNNDSIVNINFASVDYQCPLEMLYEDVIFLTQNTEES